MSVCNNNCECINKKCFQITDCNGNTTCICMECQKPYIQEQEVLAPVFIAMAVGTDKYYRSTIQKDVYKKKGKAFLHLKRPLRVGDIVEILNKC